MHYCLIISPTFSFLFSFSFSAYVYPVKGYLKALTGSCYQIIIFHFNFRTFLFEFFKFLHNLFYDGIHNRMVGVPWMRKSDFKLFLYASMLSRKENNSVP